MFLLGGQRQGRRRGADTQTAVEVVRRRRRVARVVCSGLTMEKMSAMANGGALVPLITPRAVVRPSTYREQTIAFTAFTLNTCAGASAGQSQVQVEAAGGTGALPRCA